MKSTMGLILASGKNSKLKELVQARASSAIPIGGKFRAIDFCLSSMVNSGITKVGIITQYNFRSLMDHLGTGREWDLDRRSEGLYVFPPFLSGERSGWYRGGADAIHANIQFLKRSYEEYVIIAQGNCVYKMNFNYLLQFHEEKDADITIAYRDVSDISPDEQANLGMVYVDNSCRVVDMQEKHVNPPKGYNGSMGIYLIKRKLLIAIMENSVAHGDYDLVKDVIIKRLKELKVYGYKFEGYWRSIGTVNAYYRCNMEMLDAKVREELFVRDGQIYTKVKDQPPAKFNDEAQVQNSIVADGCIVEGNIENSVIFRGVTINKEAVVRNSIVMQDTVVGKGALLENVILDKEVIVSDGLQLRGARDWPIVIGKGVLI